MATAIPLHHRLETAWAPRRIIVGTDGSTQAALACDVAAGIARRTGAHVDIVAACEMTTVAYAPLAGTSPPVFTDECHRADATVAGAADRMLSAGAGAVATHVTIGRPGLRILEE